MRTSGRWLPFVSLLCFAAVPSPVGQDPRGQGPGERKTVRQPDADSLRRAQELARPGAEHQRLAKLVGNWRVTMRTFAGSGSGAGAAPPQVDRGSCIGQQILGGRYVVLNFQLEQKARRIEAVQLVGFDKLRRRFTASWRDSASTWPVACAGEPGEQKDLLSLRGSLVDALTPDGRPFRLEIDLRTKDQVDVRIFEPDAEGGGSGGGGEVLLQEQQWRR